MDRLSKLWKGCHIYCKNGEIWHIGVNFYLLLHHRTPLNPAAQCNSLFGYLFPLFWVHVTYVGCYARSRGGLCGPALSQLMHQILMMIVSLGVGTWSKPMKSEWISGLTIHLTWTWKKYEAETIVDILWSCGTTNEIHTIGRGQQRERTGSEDTAWNLMQPYLMAHISQDFPLI